MKSLKSRYILAVSIIMFCGVLYIPNVIASQLAYWQFEQNLNDSSGSPLYNLSPYGVYGYAADPADPATGNYSLNDYNASAYLYSSMYTPENDFSVEFYFKRPDVGGGCNIIGNEFRDGELTYGWRVYIQGDGLLKVQIFNGDSYYQAYDANVMYDDNEWHHIAFSLSSTNLLTMYVDGSFVDETQGSFGASALTGVMMGSGPGGAFVGQLDDVIIWDENIFPPPEVVPEPLTCVLTTIGALFAIKRSRKA